MILRSTYIFSCEINPSLVASVWRLLCSSVWPQTLNKTCLRYLMRLFLNIYLCHLWSERCLNVCMDFKIMSSAYVQVTAVSPKLRFQTFWHSLQAILSTLCSVGWQRQIIYSVAMRRHLPADYIYSLWEAANQKKIDFYWLEDELRGCTKARQKKNKDNFELWIMQFH